MFYYLTEGPIIKSLMPRFKSHQEHLQEMHIFDVSAWVHRACISSCLLESLHFSLVSVFSKLRVRHNADLKALAHQSHYNVLLARALEGKIERQESGGVPELLYNR